MILGFNLSLNNFCNSIKKIGTKINSEVVVQKKVKAQFVIIIMKIVLKIVHLETRSFAAMLLEMASRNSI